MADDGLVRCSWANLDDLLRNYHDNQWGVPEHDDRELFEMLNLEGAQAGLSWLTILRKRNGYKQAFDDFNAEKMAVYDSEKVAELLNDPGIIRNRLKVQAFMGNAKSYINIVKTNGSFDKYIWHFVDGKPLDASEGDKANEISKLMSSELKKAGFKFVGPMVCFSFMQATGLINDHEKQCYRYEQIRRQSL